MNFKTFQQYLRDDLRVHIYSEAFLQNLQTIKKLCQPETKFCAVVKSDAYGCGMRDVVKILKKGQVDFFAVANIREAVHIEDLTGSSKILILEPIHTAVTKDLVRLCAEKSFHCAVVDRDALRWVMGCLVGLSVKLNVHVKVETGMGRCGTSPENASALIRDITNAENLRLAGVYTHFSTAAESSLAFAGQQLGRFKDFIDKNCITHRDDVILHAANSVTMLNIPEAHFDMVRCGIALHGWPDGGAKLKAGFVPAMKFEAPIVQLNKFGKGQTIGYGRTYTAPRDITAAVIPVGYSDNYWRLYSNRAFMKVCGKFAGVIGRVSMDKTLIDVTDIAGVNVGDYVTIIDNDHDSACGVYQLSTLADTICHEVLASIPSRAVRVVH